MNVLRGLQKSLQDLLPRPTEPVPSAQNARGLQRLHVRPDQVPPVLTLLRGQDTFERRFKEVTPQTRPNVSKSRRGPVDLGFSSDSFTASPTAASYGGTLKDGFEPARRPPVVMKPSDFTRPLTADQASVRYLTQLGVSFG